MIFSRKTLLSAVAFLAISGCMSMGPNIPITLEEKAPLLETTDILKSPTAFLMSDMGKWKELENSIVNTKSKYITVLWEGDGGYLFMGEHFIDHIKIAQAQGKIITFKAVGDSYSMHALSVCFASKYDDNARFLMFHAEGIGEGANYKRLPRSQSTIEWMLNVCRDRGILTQQQIDRLYEGYEIYIWKDRAWERKDPRPLKESEAPAKAGNEVDPAIRPHLH